MAKHKHWDGITKIKSSWGFMLNEGGTPFNATLIWGSPSFRLFFYVYLFGRRASFVIKNKGSAHA